MTIKFIDWIYGRVLTLLLKNKNKYFYSKKIKIYYKILLIRKNDIPNTGHNSKHIYIPRIYDNIIFNICIHNLTHIHLKLRPINPAEITRPARLKILRIQSEIINIYSLIGAVSVIFVWFHRVKKYGIPQVESVIRVQYQFRRI